MLSYSNVVGSCENDGVFTQAYRWILQFIDKIGQEVGWGENICEIVWGIYVFQVFSL